MEGEEPRKLNEGLHNSRTISEMTKEAKAHEAEEARKLSEGDLSRGSSPVGVGANEFTRAEESEVEA